MRKLVFGLTLAFAIPVYADGNISCKDIVVRNVEVEFKQLNGKLTKIQYLGVEVDDLASRFNLYAFQPVVEGGVKQFEPLIQKNGQYKLAQNNDDGFFLILSTEVKQSDEAKDLKINPGVSNRGATERVIKPVQDDSDKKEFKNLLSDTDVVCKVF